MKNKDIEDIIIEYCEGFEHLEFNYSDLPKMAEKIKEELATENHRLRIALPPLPKKEILKAPERREILGYTAAQMMDYANAAVSATWNRAHTLYNNIHRHTL